MEYLFADGNRHYSPIKVEEAKPLKSGKGLLLVRFFHLNYSQGVQSKEYEVKVILRNEQCRSHRRPGSLPETPKKIWTALPGKRVWIFPAQIFWESWCWGR